MTERTAERPAQVLVVDDSADLRALVVVVLQRQGYDVAQAGSSTEALALIEKNSFDLIVTDHHLPDLPGPDFARRAAAARPGTPVLFISGAPMPERILAVEGSVTTFLLKPFGIEDLERVARETLAGGVNH